jgi:hypothetical protein
MMCGHSHRQNPKGGAQMLSVAGSPVRTSAPPDERRASGGSDPDCGPSSRVSFAWFDPDSLSWRTAQICFTGDLATFSATWPRSGSMHSGKCYRRACSVPHTHESDCSSLPTLTVVSCEHPGRRKIKPHQQDCVSGALHRRDGWADGGQINPSHAAWLMGFPDSWTDLDLSETL